MNSKPTQYPLVRQLNLTKTCVYTSIYENSMILINIQYNHVSCMCTNNVYLKGSKWESNLIIML